MIETTAIVTTCNLVSGCSFDIDLNVHAVLGEHIEQSVGADKIDLPTQKPEIWVCVTLNSYAA